MREYKSDGSRRIPSTNLVHQFNHTFTKRICTIHKDQVIPMDDTTRRFTVDNNHRDFTNIMPGIYAFNIDGVDCYADLYLAMYEYASYFLHVDSLSSAYILNGLNKFYISLYKKVGETDTNISLLGNTPNSFVDMIYINGKSTLTGEPSLDNPATLEAIARFDICTTKDSFASYPAMQEYDPNQIFDAGDAEVIPIYLKNSIRSLPNGVHDEMILNADHKVNHFIFNTDEHKMHGGEDWYYLEDFSNPETMLFYYTDSNVKVADATDNLICTHFKTYKYSELHDKTCTATGICTSNDPEFPGILIRIPRDSFEYEHNAPLGPLREWLYGFAENGNQITLHYELVNRGYGTVYIDEYHIKTFFNNTAIKILNNTAVSYFYKAFHKNNG